MPSSAQTGDHKAHKNFRANLQLIATLLDENIHNAVRMIERNDPSASELLRFLRRQNLVFFSAATSPTLACTRAYHRRIAPGSKPVCIDNESGRGNSSLN